MQMQNANTPGAPCPFYLTYHWRHQLHRPIDMFNV